VSVRYFRHVGRISGTPYLGPDARDARLSKREGSTTGRTWAESDRQMARELPAARNKWANFDMQIRPRNRAARILRAIAPTIAGRDKEPFIIRETEHGSLV